MNNNTEAIKAALIEAGADPDPIRLADFIQRLAELGYEVRRIRAVHRRKQYDE